MLFGLVQPWDGSRGGFLYTMAVLRCSSTTSWDRYSSGSQPALATSYRYSTANQHEMHYFVINHHTAPISYAKLIIDITFTFIKLFHGRSKNHQTLQGKPTAQNGTAKTMSHRMNQNKTKTIPTIHAEPKKTAETIIIIRKPFPTQYKTPLPLASTTRAHPPPNSPHPPPNSLAWHQ